MSKMLAQIGQQPLHILLSDSLHKITNRTTTATYSSIGQPT
jgi:hypothetical protein